MKIVTPSDEFKQDMIDSIINAVGRDILLQTVSERQECYVCSGSDAYCLTCSGEGYVTTVKLESYKAKVLWASSENTVYTKAGQFVEGDVVVTLPYVEGLQENLSKTKLVFVDNRACIIDKYVLEGSPVNRIRVILKEDESPYQKT